MARGSDDSLGPLRGELVPARDPGSLRDWAELLVSQARDEGIALTGDGGLLTDLMRHVLQTGLEVEMGPLLIVTSLQLSFRGHLARQATPEPDLPAAGARAGSGVPRPRRAPVV